MSQSVPAATRAFDRLAVDYDRLAGGEIFQLLRQRTHQAFARWLRAGCRVLEIGCGTGLDTEYLASRGVRVVACDPSEAMVMRSLRRLASANLAHRAVVLPCGLQDLEPHLDAMDGGRSGFDGIISNFGALNCVERLEPLGTLVERFLRPGGVVLLNVMNRSCALEALYFAITGRRALAGRRSGRPAVAVPVAGIEVPTFFHRVSDIRRTLGQAVVLRRVEGIGVVVPPPYLEPRWRALPAGVQRAATRVDALVARWPPFNRLGDHVLVHFVKRREADV